MSAFACARQAATAAVAAAAAVEPVDAVKTWCLSTTQHLQALRLAEALPFEHRQTLQLDKHEAFRLPMDCQDTFAVLFHAWLMMTLLTAVNDDDDAQCLPTAAEWGLVTGQRAR